MVAGIWRRFSPVKQSGPPAYSGRWKSHDLPVVGGAGQRQGPSAECLPVGRAFQSYDPGMSDRKVRVTVTIDPHLAAYAEHLVEAGKAPSVSAVVNDALTERVERDRRIARRWKELTAPADMAQVERMIAHVEAQAAQLPPSHRYR